MRGRLETTFRALRVRNYRLFFLGQVVSVTGTWMQVIAQGWLVYEEITNHSALALGVITALQQVPVLFFGAWGGVLTDRFDKRRMIVLTQAVSAVTSFALAALVFTHTATVTWIGVIVVVIGFVTVVDIPTRQAFINELVEPEDVINAVGLNSALFNATRIVGPGVAAILIRTAGTGWCFLINGVSFVAVIIGLVAMRTSELAPTPRVTRAKGQVREGLRYIKSQPELRANLVLMLIAGLLAVNFPVVLPVLAKETFHGDAGTYGLLTGAMGVGALAGGLHAAGRRSFDERLMALGALGFGGGMCIAALAPSLRVILPLLVFTGALNITFFAASNTLLQLQAAPEMRGRVLAVRVFAVMGTTPIGAPIIGWVCAEWGGRWGLAVGGVATLAGGAWLLLDMRGRRHPHVEAEGSGAPLVSDPATA
ncbi:MAG: transporter [Actinomycetia bacterium]|nr:transporter [Actinomycetes bacterium]